MPIEVQARLSYGQWHDIEVEDDVTAYVRYSNGATGVFITSTGDACGTNRFEIIMDKAKLIAEHNSLSLYVLETSEPEFNRANTEPFGCPNGKNVEIKTDGQSGQHTQVLNRFAAAILRGEPLTANGSEGINGLTLSNAMHLSDWLGKPVTLPLDEELFLSELDKRVKTSRRKENVTSVIADTSGSYNAGDYKKSHSTKW